MRTNKEILDRIKELENEDWLGFERSDLIAYLSFEDAKPFLKEEAEESGWSAEENTREAIIATILDYMPFAWDKANNCRGISASRNMSHMSAWLWLLGELDKFGDLQDYEFYGKPNLKAICEHFGWDWRQWDNDCWQNSESSEGITADAATVR